MTNCKKTRLSDFSDNKSSLFQTQKFEVTESFVFHLVIVLFTKKKKKRHRERERERNFIVVSRATDVAPFFFLVLNLFFQIRPAILKLLIDTLSRPLDREREKDLRIETTPAIPARYGKTIATVSFREQELATKKKKKKKNVKSASRVVSSNKKYKVTR